MNGASTTLPREAVVLSTLGQRVRALRDERGITRRELSRATGISERYIGLLESGQANISVLVLHRLAHAMDVAVQRLLV